MDIMMAKLMGKRRKRRRLLRLPLNSKMKQRDWA